MLKATFIAVALSGCLVATGCSRTPESPAVSQNGPLSIEEWRHLNPNLKFDIEVVNRLKQGHPELNTRKGWNDFLKTEMNTAISQSAPKVVSSL